MQQESSETYSSKDFFFSDGERVSSIDSLADKISQISEDEFRYHVNPQKNDFADWIDHVFSEKILSNLLRKAKNKEVLLTILSSFLETRAQMKEFQNKNESKKEQTSQISSISAKSEKPGSSAQKKSIAKSNTAEAQKNNENIPLPNIPSDKPLENIEIQRIEKDPSIKREEKNSDIEINSNSMELSEGYQSNDIHFEVTQEIDPIQESFEESDKGLDKNNKSDGKEEMKRKDLEPIQEENMPKKKSWFAGNIFQGFKDMIPRRKILITPNSTIADIRSKEEKELDIYAPEFIQTGIPGFDSLITNGIPKGSSVLMSGGAGSGKTTFCLHLIANASKNGEKCLYLTFEEEPARLRSHMINYGWDPIKLEKEGNLMINKMDPFELSRSVEGLLAKASGELIIELDQLEGIIPKGFKPDRVIIDSLSAVAAAFIGKEEGYRIYVEQLFNLFKQSGATSFLISEIEENTSKYTKSGVEEFLADAVIIFYNLRQKSVRVNAIEVVKLRGTSHQKKIVPFKIISGEGIKVFPKEDPFIE